MRIIFELISKILFEIFINFKEYLFIDILINIIKIVTIIR